MVLAVSLLEALPYSMAIYNTIYLVSLVLFGICNPEPISQEFVIPTIKSLRYAMCHKEIFVSILPQEFSFPIDFSGREVGLLVNLLTPG
jgi:hypothetical protein